MEPPGTAGAPGAAGRPWEEAKAFYDNLAPKKKPKSVRAPEPGSAPHPGGGPDPPGAPSPPGASPRGCAVSSRSPWVSPAAPSPLGSLGSSWVPPLPCVPLWNSLSVPYLLQVLWGPPCVSLVFL